MTSIDDLHDLMEIWLAARPTRSLSVLSRQSGVPYPTLRRVWLRENIPNLETILALLCIVASPEQAREFTVKHIPSVAGFFSLVHPANKISMDAGVGEILRDRIAFAIFAMAGAAGGTTQADVERKFGEDGEACLRRMLSAGALILDSTGIVRTVCAIEVTDTRLLLDLIRHTIDLFDLHKVRESCVSARLHTDGLSDTGVLRLADAINSFNTDVKKIVESHPGPNVLMFGMVSSFLTTNKTEVSDESGCHTRLQGTGA